MTAPQSVVVVGASAAGLATADALRRAGWTGRLTLVDAEPHPPYDRPPLSKQFLAGDWDEDRLHLRPPAAFAALDATLLLDDPAVHLDVAHRTVTTRSGRTLTADAVVIATGVRARWLPGQGPADGAHVLRSLDDARRLRSRLASTPGSVAVLGHGVLGSEVASTARQLGHETTLLGSGRSPMSGVLGSLGTQTLRDRHEAAGVRLVDRRRAVAIDTTAAGTSRIRLDDGTVDADHVVVAIGSTPATDWLDDSGLVLEDGVRCDEACAAAPGVWAVGDVARWYDLRLGRTVRLENRTNATEQARVVAANILGADTPYRPTPYFWTDQYGARIHVYGNLSAADGDAVLDEEVVDGDPTVGRFVVVARHEGRPVGVLGWAMPKQARIAAQQLSAQDLAGHGAAHTT